MIRPCFHTSAIVSMTIKCHSIVLNNVDPVTLVGTDCHGNYWRQGWKKYETCNRWYCNPRVIRWLTSILSIIRDSKSVVSISSDKLSPCSVVLGVLKIILHFVWTEASTNVCRLCRLVNCRVFTIHKCFVVATESFFFPIKIFKWFLILRGHTAVFAEKIWIKRCP